VHAAFGSAVQKRKPPRFLKLFQKVALDAGHQAFDPTELNSSFLKQLLQMRRVAA
jgi:hypothetical protein